jgi:predicted RNA-binding protein YlqC (UPF0109 family)
MGAAGEGEAVKALVETIVRALVDHPDAVEVTEIEGVQTTTIELKVHEADMGKVIGRNGRMIEAIRTIVRAASTKGGRRANIELVETRGV